MALLEKQTVYVVSGFPRSGTTAMMQALEAGGLETVKNVKRAEFLRYNDDAEFKARAGFESSPKDRRDPAWPTQHRGKAVKAVAMWLSDLAVCQYRVVVMRRDSEEIRQSFEAAFADTTSCDFIEAIVEESLRGLANRRDVLSVDEIWYDHLLCDPQGELARINWPIDCVEAARVIDPDKKRFHIQSLVRGA